MSNSLIARVKQYRARHGCTLKEAHDAVTAGRDMEDFSQPLHPPAMPDEITRLTALVEHLKADRIRISEEAEAEIARLKVESGAARMCLNCGKIVPASHPRHEPLPECVGPEGLSACTFDATPQESWQIWRDRYYALREEAATARKEGRLEGLEEAAKVADRGMLVPPDGGSPNEDEIRVAEYIAAAIRSLMEKQP